MAASLFAAIAQNLMHRDAEPALLQHDESPADVDVVEQRVHDYGRGSVSPVSKLPHFTLVALAMLARPLSPISNRRTDPDHAQLKLRAPSLIAPSLATPLSHDGCKLHT
jgi:hypothetical protein